jgi:hypothetical protein
MTFQLPKKRKKEKMGLRVRPQWRSSSYLRFIRSLECVLAHKPGHECVGPIEAMHVRTGTDCGLGVKPSDYWTIPGCAIGAHKWQSDHGEPAFEKKWGIDMKQIAEAIWKRSPHYRKWLLEKDHTP